MWFLTEKQFQKESYDSWHWKLALIVRFLHFLRIRHYVYSQNTIMFFQYVDFWIKIQILLILDTPGLSKNTSSHLFPFYILYLLSTLIFLGKYLFIICLYIFYFYITVGSSNSSHSNPRDQNPREERLETHLEAEQSDEETDDKFIDEDFKGMQMFSLSSRLV